MASAAVLDLPPAAAALRDDEFIPSCPRCGYDLAGNVHSWRESCPLHGTCSECGLDLDWTRLFSKDNIAPGWSFEHTEGVSVLAYFATALRTIRPKSLWTGLRIDCPVRLLRLMLFMIGLAASAHLVVAATAITMDIMLEKWYSGDSPIEWAIEHINTLVFPYTALIGDDIPVGAPAGAVLLMLTLMPLSLLLLGQSFQNARVRRVHIIRAFCYSLSSFLAWSWLILTAAAFVAYRARTGWFTQPANADAAYACVILTIPIWMMLWWQACIKRYLKLPHSWAVAILLTVMVLLATPVIGGVLVFAGQMAWELVHFG